MASARCEKCGHPQGLKQSYTHLHTLSRTRALWRTGLQPASIHLARSSGI